MKKKKLIAIILISIFICVICLSVAVSKALDIIYQEDITAVNACYEPLVDCINNGFDKEKATENKEVFKKGLECVLTDKVYRASKFYGQSIIFSNQHYGSDIPDANKEYQLKDVFLAMYLTCVLTTEPENLSQELNWLKEGVWPIAFLPEFLFLLSDYYEPTQEEVDILFNAIETFSDTLEEPYDKLNTLSLIHMFNNLYNESHPDNKLVIKNSEEYYEKLADTKNQVDKKLYSKKWIGYGKYRELNLDSEAYN